MEITSFKIGDSFNKSKCFTEEDVRRYAELTGDFNPIHFSQEFASKTIFRKPIVHGPLVLTFVTTIFANELPGPGTIYLSHEVKYLNPVYIGDSIVANLTIIEITDKAHLLIETICYNESNEIVLSGVARLKKM
ncbi:MAG: MaoC family dehydratase [Flavobacteriia bacterium]|nr:MaoC family dehydratase [Flavobacteriia bacterium]